MLERKNSVGDVELNLEKFPDPGAFFPTRKDSIQIGMDLSNVKHFKLAIFPTSVPNYKPSNIVGKIFD